MNWKVASWAQRARFLWVTGIMSVVIKPFDCQRRWIQRKHTASLLNRVNSVHKLFKDTFSSVSDIYVVKSVNQGVCFNRHQREKKKEGSMLAMVAIALLTVRTFLYRISKVENEHRNFSAPLWATSYRGGSKIQSWCLWRKRRARRRRSMWKEG